MNAAPRPVPVFRISFTNATVLSTIYLLVATVVELLRRSVNPRWAERVSLALEAFPARTLELLGLFEPLRRAWVQGALSDTGVRLIYGLTTIALIFALGLAVGLGMWVIARLSGASVDDSGPTQR
jgi:hypothetical protein